MAQSFIEKLYQTRFRGLPFSAPAVGSRTTEAQLVRSVLQMLQGFSSSLFYWDDSEHAFHVKSGTHVPHLSLSSLNDILGQFIHTANCLQLVEGFVKHVRMYSQVYPPTMKAFTDSVFERLKNLRRIALNEEEKSTTLDNGTKTTLLALVENLKCVCAGAEFLLQIIREAVPCNYLDSSYSIHASEMAVHILDYLYLKLNEVCLVQDGEDGAYHMLLILFIGSLQPLIQGLDSWLYEGILDDPFEELFFYANDAITINEADFWQKGYSLRQLVSHAINKEDVTSSSVKQVRESYLGKSDVDVNGIVCPLFLQELAKPIVSAGKSLQLLRHLSGVHSGVYGKDQEFENLCFSSSKNHASDDISQSIGDILAAKHMGRSFLSLGDNELEDGGYFDQDPASQVKQMLHTKGIGGLTLSELFCVSFVALIGDDIHLCKHFNQEYPWSPEIARICNSYTDKENLDDNIDKKPTSNSKSKIWCRFFMETILQKAYVITKGEVHRVYGPCAEDRLCIPSIKHLSPRNPSIAACYSLLEKNHALWEKLSVSTFWFLPPLNDWPLRKAIFGKNDELTVTDYLSCLGISKLNHNCLKDMEALFPFPTVLPCWQEDLAIMDFLPSQKNSTGVLRVLSWIQHCEVMIQLLPVVIVQECLAIYIKKQVDYVGKQILSKLMNSWRLLDELAVLRAIYLLGSGDLLQQFLAVLFDKLDEGETWDDYFELNTMLQDSIRNSADGTLLGSPDSLTVTISKHHNQDDDESRPSLGLSLLISSSQCFGINAFDVLEFTYKVSWPLEVIVNQDAMRKYNQVLAFLLKVKRAKFVLDKTRRWMWKDRSSSSIRHKHLLPQQKLLHFVDAFHQYVMDRVLHNAWLELSEGMASARSLDEVIEVHESYLMSIQRQCFVASDKLLALIASRTKSILGLALDFHSIQRTLCCGGAGPAVKARCEMEADRIEKQFDDCIAFLLKVLSSKTNVGHFPHLADLVTRINYNYFYMSDDGSLVTVPGIETAASRTGNPNLSASR